MKYIRTKDGKIYDTLDERGMAISQIRKQCDFVDFVTFQNRLGDFAIPKTEIVKQADTIEELCDTFVWDEDLCHIDFKKKTLVVVRDDFEFDLDWCLEDKPIYGAIWTDKGLIYVAKMNEKGELELL